MVAITCENSNADAKANCNCFTFGSIQCNSKFIYSSYSFKRPNTL